MHVVHEFERPVRDHDAPALVVRHSAGLDGLGDCADLVHLEEKARAGLLLNACLDPLDVGHLRKGDRQTEVQRERESIVCVRV